MRNKNFKISKYNLLKLSIARWLKKRSNSKQWLFNYLLSSKMAVRSTQGISALGAVKQVQNAYKNVPAYRKFLNKHTWKYTSGLSFEELMKTLPSTDKHEYIDHYSTADRCLYGKIPHRLAEIDESSGSSGKPYNWIRGREELVDLRRTLSKLATYLYGPDLVTINGFSMGAWATGTNVTMALVENGLIKSTGPDPEKMISCLELLGKDKTYVITGYPPFLLELIEFGRSMNFPWEDYKIVGVVGGEAMSETLRSRLLEVFQIINSAYGASEVDIGVACEFPLSIWVRQQANKNPELAEALFGSSRRMPMLFQYDPLDYYPEQNEAGELVVTVNRPSALSPRLRYNVHDIGGTIEFDKLLAICKSFGLDPIKNAPLPFYGKHPKLPFLYIGGRSDSTISYLGANIYPEDVEQGIFGDAPDEGKSLIEGFAIELMELTDGKVRPCIHIELSVGADKDKLNTNDIKDRVVNRLEKNSRDFRTALLEDKKAGDFKILLHDNDSGPFKDMGDRIKRKYIIKK